MERAGTGYLVEVNPKIPSRLHRLEELANDLWYSWDSQARSLFSRLHPALWEAVGHSPTILLKRVGEERLEQAAQDPEYLYNYNRVLAVYDTDHDAFPGANGPNPLARNDMVAYFCFEFGFHESLPIYSGGLGILAGDHCKAASDVKLPLVGIGLLYRQGHFLQTIDAEGNQQAIHVDSEFDDLPVAPVMHNGGELRVEVEIVGRAVSVKVWQVRVGHVRIYLLDTDLTENTERDRDITHRLYGGDRDTRIVQEIVLGIGGVRALDALGVRPTVWHMNEGHAAFLVLERLRRLMRDEGLDFASALESVAANTVFTTHTAVPAGHDRFPEDMVAGYFDHYCRELHLDREALLALGRAPGSNEFNMTALALRGSRFRNGVSRIHRDVSARMLSHFWPQIPVEENPVDYVTNGVHVATFLSPDWTEIFDKFLGFGWTQRLGEPGCAERIAGIPDHILWSRHQFLKAQMLHLVRFRITAQHFRNGGSQAHLDRLLQLADPDNPNVLTIGFARRFATYKRATLLFEDLDWLREITSDPQRPVLFIFAGKAHPADEPGREIVRRVAKVACTSEFEGKILLVEGFDMRLARRLVSGVDVWLNNPIYPLEASGTSGMKAGINGVINLSVLDGWWGEGYQGDNGWAIKPVSETLERYVRDAEEARTLYEILQDHVVPIYYGRGDMGYSPEWVKLAKRSMASTLGRFSAARMLSEYVSKFYSPASHQGRNYAEQGHQAARTVAKWKAQVRSAWPGVTVRRLDASKRRVRFGERLAIEIGVRLNGLGPEDVAVEMLVTSVDGVKGENANSRHMLASAGPIAETGEQRFGVDFAPEWCGKSEYRIRVYPFHAQLTHPLEMGLMVWV